MIKKEKIQTIYVTLLVVIACLSSSKTFAQHSPREIYLDKTSWLINHPSLKGYFSIDHDGIAMYASPYNKRINNVECKVYFDEAEAFLKLMYQIEQEQFLNFYKTKGTKRMNLDYLKKFPDERPVFAGSDDPEFPLKGLKVAIDPGHIAGSMEEAEFEWRFVKISGKPFHFYEAKLNYATAKFLEDTLIKLGADVFITRKKHGYTAFNKTFDQWMKQDFIAAVDRELTKKNISYGKARYLKYRASRQHIFHHFFKRLDLTERARLINDYEPHLTIVIHYNAHYPSRHDRYGHLIPVSDNYNMAFVPGSFLPGEMWNAQSRMSFLRLLLSDHVNESIKLSNEIVESFTTHLQVPALKTTNQPEYAKSLCLHTPCNGVLMRNLILNRYVKGPICYGETFCQNNVQESARLARNEIEIAGMYAPYRTKEVAIAYLDGIMKYLGVVNLP